MCGALYAVESTAKGSLNNHQHHTALHTAVYTDLPFLMLVCLESDQIFDEEQT